ncbi:right-handed parallel beta-helix repeat-containing protein [candidate division KSB1 bacterium]|nr:right-handed parallel beta-helix repeat-containing protein [candidate division KSB1 bacterium]MBL7095505.1 right-handed parallel beta-helix repeat-containing protein [candidate division KSB1 bacterium]
MPFSKTFLIIILSLLFISGLWIPSIVGSEESVPVTTQTMSIPKNGSVHTLVIFVGYQDQNPGNFPSYAGDIFSPNVNNSIRHYYNIQSYGNHTITGDVVNQLYYAPYDHDESPTPTRDQVVRSILQQVDPVVDFSVYDNWDDQNQNNSDGFVDMIFFNIANSPHGSVAALLLMSDYTTNDTWAGGDVKIRSSSGTWQRTQDTLDKMVGIMAHEYGHQLGLYDLYDFAYFYDPRPAPEEFSAGFGFWGLMSEGYGMWGLYSLSAYNKEFLGWKTVVDVSSNMFNVTVNTETLYKINPSNLPPDEYFLISYRDHSNFYEQKLPNGLLIWHIDNQGVYYNDNEYHKMVDLECADGLFSDKGYPGTVSDPISGGDNLDYWAKPQICQANADYTAEHNGNTYDSTDPFDGVTFTSFTPYTNPNSNGYNGNQQNNVSHLAITNIRPGGICDIILNYWEGDITSNTTWSSTNSPYYIGGDVTISSGATLTIEPNTEVVFIAATDNQNSGRHTSLSELTIEGKLEADGVTFTSTVQSPGAWYGILLDNADDNSYIENCSINYAQSGIYCLNGSDINIEDNTIRYCLLHGINLYNSSPYIHENLIENGSTYGIYLSGSFPHIYNNKIQNNTSHYGVFYNYASGGYLRHNTIKNNIGGVRCAGGSSPNLVGRNSSEPYGANEIIQNGLGGNWWGVCPSDYSQPNLGVTNDSTNYLAGRNSIHENTTWQIKNLSSIPVYARRNYWKNYPPYNYGTVVVSSPTVVALPNAGALWKTQGNEVQILEYLSKAQELEGQHKLKDAIDAYRWVIDNYPESDYADFAFARLMSCRSQQGELSMEENYTASLVTNYSDCKIGEGAILWLPAIAAKQGRKSEAVSLTTNWMTGRASGELEKALLYQLAMIYYYEFQDYKAARETMDTFVEKFPDDIRSFDIKNLDFLFDYTPDLPKQDPGTIKEPIQVIDNYVLEQNYPNPFNPETEICFQLPEDVNVTLSIYNMLGQRVCTLIDKQMQTGYHSIKWDGRNDFRTMVASGVYLYVIHAGKFYNVKKMVLMQ